MSNFTPGATQAQKIMEWRQSAETLKRIKDLEMAQRKELFGEMFPEPKKGTNTHELGHGYKLKAVYAFEDKLDPTSYDLIAPELRNLSDEDQAAVQEAIKWTPSLVAKGYKALSEAARDVLNEAVVTKPKTVTLTLVEPKEKA